VNFARMDGVDRLLGRGVLRFDMRDPSRFVLRLPPGQSKTDAPAVTSAKADTVVTTGSAEPKAATPAASSQETEG
jgi:cell division protein FtsQ